ncbi:ferric-chelate reductase (Fre2) [Cordyceps fumosorosea ARSEF 2679]|uniref:Ferric-chelate reductase (Fre2) n=1 Tax=Cordyceps fumosorosea (strain ARSEF 2679) TaxID=1081104 RepID=A0A167M7U3_CORFA|nr:ferric-chelate reductase (Fre2) [Cordyceps fumosorosea ARSEF 2679]OAA54042.1 ferric-chelate reductase (Fre2) [Cordyceps fumosorosea ARSEF 2679]
MASHHWISILSLLALLGLTGADVTSPGAHGFLGFGISLYDPYCAFVCEFSLFVPINCTTADLAIVPKYLRRRDADEAAKPVWPSGDGWAVTTETTPTCLSRNEFYLQTLAYCIKSHCTSIPTSAAEKFWEGQLVKLPDGSGPKSYTDVVAAISEPPTRPVNATQVLNYTGIVPEEQWQLLYRDVSNSAMNEIRHSLYSLIILITGAGIPIAMSLLRFLPWPAAWVTKVNAYLIDPPLVGSKHSTPIWGLGIMPTRGQALFILYLWVINVVLSSIGYENQLGIWYETVKAETMRNLANRLGVLAYANVPLVILYAGRNNFLLWLTNWSHSTFLLLHRWAAFICMMHAVLHSLVYLEIALHSEGWAEEFTEPYWYWGSAGTIGFVILCVKSIQPIRQRIYEIFLAAHIVITVLVIVCSYKHVNVKYTDAWGYQNWLWMACAIWGFDRLVRLARSLRAGFKRAYFTPIDEDYYRLDIPGVSADGHVYLHFPTISTWRFWENHPFSVAGVTYLQETSTTASSVVGDEKEKGIAASTTAVGSGSGSGSDSESAMIRKESGIAVFIRRQSGLTALLAKKGPCPKGIPVFVEGSYNHKATFLQEDHPEPTHEFPNLLCIAGGVGITGVLPAVDRFNTAGKPLGTKKLFWGARTWPLVREVERMQLCGPASQSTSTERRWGDVDVTLAVGERLDIRRILTQELRQQKGGTVIVVCGPSGMVDDVRCIASALGRHDEAGKAVVVKLMIESFTW